jgi:DNA-binding winged helix-turn-helix (wHTH) protein/tetratricopeptide (TPR) repeat protein
VLRFADFQIDPLRAELRRLDGEIIKLRPKPFDMLVFFVSEAGRVIGKRELMERFWPGVHVGEDSLFQCIREIRAVLGDNQRQILRNISGRGYLFEAQVTGRLVTGSLPGTDQTDLEPVSPEAAGAEIAPSDSVDAAARRPTIAPAEADVVHIHPDQDASIAVADPVIIEAMVSPPDQGVAVIAVPTQRPRLSRRAIAAAIVAVLLGAAGVAMAPILGSQTLMRNVRPTVVVTSIVTTGGDASMRAMAAGVTDRLSAGLSRIENIRVVAPAQVTARASLEPSSGRAPSGDYIVNTELLKDEQNWTLRSRMERTSNGEIAWSTDVTVAGGDVDRDMLQSRLAAAIGHSLALRLNTILNDAVAGAKGAPGSAKVAVEQATASIVHTTPERFRAAESMLRKALVDNPDNVDVQAALAALQLRGIQMVWYPADEREAVRKSAQELMERVLRVKPTYVPVLESYCRLLSATNQFVDSLVACARVLSFDPWNGLAIYHIGLNQIFLGRFEEAVTNFKLADQYDTPTVSRWTWSLGAGFALIYLERYDEALPWLERSLAVTQGTGRTHFMLVTAYHQLGRHAEAKAMLLKGLALRPGATADNIGPPTANTSPRYLEGSAKVRDILVEAGMPRR